MKELTKLQKSAEISNNKTDIWNDSCSISELKYSIEKKQLKKPGHG